MRIALAAPILAALAASAHATASLSCSAQDKLLAFSAEAVVSHGVGESVTNFRGELRVLIKGVPSSLRVLPLEGEHLTQVWVRGKDVRLRIFRDAPGEGPHASAELVIETLGKGGGDMDFRGRYELVVDYLPSASGGEARTVKARGRAACSVG